MPRAVNLLLGTRRHHRGKTVWVRPAVSTSTRALIGRTGTCEQVRLELDGEDAGSCSHERKCRVAAHAVERDE
jgi:hypothetical protein